MFFGVNLNEVKSRGSCVSVNFHAMMFVQILSSFASIECTLFCTDHCFSADCVNRFWLGDEPWESPSVCCVLFTFRSYHCWLQIMLSQTSSGNHWNNWICVSENELCLYWLRASLEAISVDAWFFLDLTEQKFRSRCRYQFLFFRCSSSNWIVKFFR